MSTLKNSPWKQIAIRAALLLAGAGAAWAAAAVGATTSAESIFNSPNATAAPPVTGAVAAGAAGNPAASPDPAYTGASAGPTSSFSDNFSSETTNTCLADGSTFGSWTSASSGLGCNQVETAGGVFWIDESPKISAASSLTRSAMILGPAFSAPIAFSVKVYTNAQLRKRGAATPGDVGSVVWNYSDSNHFYSFISRPNGWELSKEDPSYPGSRRSLTAGSSPVFPIDNWYAVKIVQVQNVIEVYVDGQLITTYTDTQSPYTSGNIALRSEDANVRFENVAVNIAPSVISAVSAYSVGQTSATVAWTTNDPADTQAEYGPTTDYASTTTTNGVLTTSHSIVLNGLGVGTLYHYAAISHDIAGDPTASADFTFTTSSAAATPVISSAAALTIMTTPFIDNFSSSTLNTCFPDGTTFGSWTSAFSGSGCTQVVSAGAIDWLTETPAISTSPSLAHSALVLGPSFAAPLTISGSLDTTALLRRNTPPNPWEVGSVVWDYTDSSHYYAFVPQPNGWYLNKEDPSYPGSQRTLATGTSPVFPIGSWYIVKIVQVQNVITVYVNGQLITTFSDAQTPYLSGSVGVQAQDSQARFADIAVNVPPAAAPTVSVTVTVPASVAAITTVSGTATLLARTSNIAATALVQFLLDGTPLGSAVNSPPFSLAWNTAVVAAGAHSLGAIIWDATGDSSIAPLVPVVVSNSAATAAAGAVDPDRAPQKFLSPALADGINDVATFGTNATEVSVYNVRGRLVFHGSQQGSAPIVWNCKDSMGRVDESGVYIAKIKTTDSGVLYQSFAIVK